MVRTERQQESECAHRETQYWGHGARFEQRGSMQDGAVPAQCNH